jgi:hypothetical protein
MRTLANRVIACAVAWNRFADIFLEIIWCDRVLGFIVSSAKPFVETYFSAAVKCCSSSRKARRTRTCYGQASIGFLVERNSDCAPPFLNGRRRFHQTSSMLAVVGRQVMLLLRPHYGTTSLITARTTRIRSYIILQPGHFWLSALPRSIRPCRSAGTSEETGGTG